MPNWTDSHLTIAVPSARSADLLDRLQGPVDWPLSSALLKSFERPGLKGISAHARVSILKDGDRLRAEFLEAAAASLNWPEWMPVGRQDVLNMVGGHPPACDKSPFSLPRLLPIRDMEEFEDHFPGALDPHGYWEFRERQNPVISFRKAKIGIQWPPSPARLAVEGPGGGYDLLHFSYQTAWLPPSRSRPCPPPPSSGIRGGGACCLD